MRSYAHRRWGFAALLLALVAVALQVVSMRHASLGMTTLARATAEGAAERLRPFARWHAARSALCGGLGLVAALLAIVCRVVARRGGEAGPSPAAMALLALYVLLLIFIV